MDYEKQLKLNPKYIIEELKKDLQDYNHFE